MPARKTGIKLKPPSGYKKYLLHYSYKDNDGNEMDGWIKLNCKKKPSYSEAKTFAQRKISINIDPNFAKRKIIAPLHLYNILV